MRRYPRSTTLSPTEERVLLLGAQGRTLRETGQLLSVTYDTVKSHRQSIFGKLGAVNMTHAVWLYCLLHTGKDTDHPENMPGHNR